MNYLYFDIEYFKDSPYIKEAYISNLDSGNGIVTLNLNSDDELYNLCLSAENKQK